MIASLILVRFSWVERKGMLTGIGVIIMALGFVVFTNPATEINAMMGNMLLGVGMSVAMVSANATLAHETPNEMRGRIMGLVFLGMGIAQLLGLPLGLVAQALTMETLFPPMSFAVLALLALVIIYRPVILKATVPNTRPNPRALSKPAESPSTEPPTTSSAPPQTKPAAKPPPACDNIHQPQPLKGIPMEYRFSDKARAFEAEVNDFLSDEWTPELQATIGDPTTDTMSEERGFRKLLAERGWLTCHGPPSTADKNERSKSNTSSGRP